MYGLDQYNFVVGFRIRKYESSTSVLPFEGLWAVLGPCVNSRVSWSKEQLRFW